MAKVEIDFDRKEQHIFYGGKEYLISVEILENPFCYCGCGERAINNSKYFSGTCRKRVSRNKNNKNVSNKILKRKNNT